MGKGSTTRPHSIPRAEYEKNYEAIFGRREIKTWNPEEDDDNDYAYHEQQGEPSPDSGEGSPGEGSSGSPSVKAD
jgi:hypothetical protein